MALHPRKDEYRTLCCAGCGASAKRPTLETDRWFACWCEQIDRCFDCGPCQECFPGVTNEMTDPHAVTVEVEGSLSVQSRF